MIGFFFFFHVHLGFACSESGLVSCIRLDSFCVFRVLCLICD